MTERAPNPPRRPRAVDVAAAAEVSTATVSRVFNNPEKVAPAIRDRVLSAARAMGWMPHAAGSALARRRTSIVGAVIPTLDNEIFAAQVGAMQTAFAERGITLLLSCFNYSQDQAFSDVQAMLARGVEGLAIVGESHKPDLFSVIAARAIPYVVTYSHRPDSPHACVGFDNQEAFERLTRRLLDLGHRDFGVIIQPTADNDRVQARLRGIRAALAEQGLAIRPQRLFEGAWSIDFGRRSLRAMLEAAARSGPRPTAIICGNDHLAIGAVLEAQAMGLRVPEDLSITGFDDLAISRHVAPPLTTLHIDNREIGRLAADYLLARLDGLDPPPPPPLLPDLIERGTTGPAPAA